jgi:YVTN family beta-propeller protein
MPAGSGAGGQAGDGTAVAGTRAPDLDSDAGAAPSDDETSIPGKTQVACTLNAYVSNSGSDSVSVIDTTSNKVIATIPTGKAPVNPTFAPDRQHVYVSNSQTDTITVIDVKTNEATAIPAGGDRPSGLAFSPDGQTLFVSLISEDYVSPGSVHSIKLATGEATPSIRMGADPERIALTPDGQHLYVSNLLDGTLAVIDTASSKIVATLMLGDLPFNPLMSKDGSLVYVGVMSANHVAVIDTKTNQILRTLPADSPNGMSFSKDLQSLFVSNAFAGTVQQVSLATNMVVKTGTVGGLSGNIAVLPDGEHAYMVRPDGTTVEVLETSTLRTVETITVGTGPSVVTVCRD